MLQKTLNVTKTKWVTSENKIEFTLIHDKQLDVDNKLFLRKSLELKGCNKHFTCRSPIVAQDYNVIFTLDRAKKTKKTLLNRNLISFLNDCLLYFTNKRPYTSVAVVYGLMDFMNFCLAESYFYIKSTFPSTISLYYQ